MMCSKLHCQKYVRLKHVSYKIEDEEDGAHLLQLDILRGDRAPGLAFLLVLGLRANAGVSTQPSTFWKEQCRYVFRLGQ